MVANIIHFLFERFIGLLELREQRFLVLYQGLDPASFALYVSLELLCGHLVERVRSEVQVGPIRKNRLEVGLIRERDVLSFFDLPFDLLKLPGQFSNLGLKFFSSQRFADFKDADEVGGVSLDRFDSHVVVHFLLHERGFS